MTEMHKRMIDFFSTPAEVEDHGSLCLVRPLEDWAEEWLKENTDGTWWCGALVVEPRYVDDLLNGLAMEVENHA